MSESELVERLERLERAHRRLKGCALAGLVLASALATIYAAQPVPFVVTAHAFEVVDQSGKRRVLMDTAFGPYVALFDVEGKPRASMYVAASGEPSIELFDAKGRARVSVDPSGLPHITLADANGFEMDLGSTQTVTPTTGQTRQTSAASIVMSGNDEKHHVIWQAP